MTAARRVASVLRAAEPLRDASHPLGREARARLRASSGLSPEGIELALTEHLEHAVHETDIDAFASKAASANRCHVVLSANVCTAALRAVAFAAATSPTLFVKASRRDPVLAELIVRALAENESFARLGATETLVTELKARAPDHVHVYGSDATIAEIRASLESGVHLEAHGSGFGIAAIAADDDLTNAARALADDVIAFDQQGCLSPRIALVEGNAMRAASFAAALDMALRSLGEAIPRGRSAEVELSAISLYRAAIEAIGSVYEGAHHLVGLDPAPRTLVLPPAARVLHVIPIFEHGISTLIHPFAPSLTAIGATASALMRTLVALAPRARVSALGQMQRPRWDGPVDLRAR